MLNTDTKGFSIENFAEFNKEYSPSVPLGFPRNLLPKGDLCGRVLSEMLLCTMNSAENLCANQAKNYYICRRERDAQIYSTIRGWETEKLGKEKDPAAYVKLIEKEKNTMEETLGNTPMTIGNKHRRWRI